VSRRRCRFWKSARGGVNPSLANSMTGDQTFSFKHAADVLTLDEVEQITI
jgi:hypothetical protein